MRYVGTGPGRESVHLVEGSVCGLVERVSVWPGGMWTEDERGNLWWSRRGNGVKCFTGIYIV